MLDVFEHEPATREHKARRTLVMRWPKASMDDYVTASKFAAALAQKYGTTHSVSLGGREQVRFMWKRGQGVTRVELRANPGRRFAVVETRGRTIVRRHGVYDDPRRAYKSLGSVLI